MGYLLVWLFEIGPMRSNGFGTTGITWTELESWRRLTGHEIDHNEAELLFELSQEYSSQFSASTDGACPAPFNQDIEVERKTVSDQLKTMLDAMVARQVAK